MKEPEDYPPPSETSKTMANAVVDWANSYNVTVDSVDEDVMGGMGVYLSGSNGRRIWVALCNNFNSIVTSSGRGDSTGHDFSWANLNRFRYWLGGYGPLPDGFHAK